MQTETIFSSYEPIRKYNDLLRLWGADAAASVHIQPIDSFLIKQVIAYYPAKPLMIDLAADLTGGESTLLLTADPGVQHIYTTQTHVAAIQSAFRALDLGDYKTTFMDGIPDEAEHWEQIGAAFDAFTLPLFLLAVDEDEALGSRFEARFEHLAQLVPEPVVLVLPIGMVGESRVIEAAVRFCTLDSPYRFTVLRELSPFWGTSQLGMISRRENGIVGDILKRIGQLYEGNFDFVTLLETHLGEQIRANLKISPEMEQELKRLSVKQPAELETKSQRQNLSWSERLQITYQERIPLQTRLIMRDVRMALLKRVRKPKQA